MASELRLDGLQLVLAQAPPLLLRAAPVVEGREGAAEVLREEVVLLTQDLDGAGERTDLRPEHVDVHAELRVVVLLVHHWRLRELTYASSLAGWRAAGLAGRPHTGRRLGGGHLRCCARRRRTALSRRRHRLECKCSHTQEHEIRTNEDSCEAAGTREQNPRAPLPSRASNDLLDACFSL